MPKFSDELIHQLSIETSKKIDEIQDKNVEIVLIPTKFDRDFTLLTTSGLSEYTLPIREEENSEPHIELCFALPSYWDLTFQHENCAWVLEKLKFLVNFVLDKETHFWDGHSMPNANPNRAISKIMFPDQFFFSKSILYPEKLSEVQLGDRVVHLLFVIPIFQMELDYKRSRGKLALKKKLVNANVGEILDDFRTSAIKKRFGLF